jgi:hypothetical protein
MSEQGERVTLQPSDRTEAGCAGVWGQRPHGDTA